jgi:hypothetical protein
VTSRYPIHLIETPLIVKRGGHADQLSRAWGLDKYRIESISKLLSGAWLTDSLRRAAIRALRGKCAVYAGGCRKRGREEEATYYERLAERAESIGHGAKGKGQRA